MTSKRERLQLSDKARQAAKKMAGDLAETDRRVRERTPEAPSGSGETGKYNEKLSVQLGGRSVYETESGVVFFYNGIGEPIPVDEEYLDRARARINNAEDTSDSIGKR